MKVARILAGAAAVLALGAVPATSAHAQVHFGASGGISIPLGNFGDAVSSGYIVNGLVEGTPGGLPVALRGEVNYSGYSYKGPLSGTSNLLGFLGNAVINFDKPNSGPYLIGGLGVYHSTVSGYSGSSNNFGLNGGGGYRFALGGVSTFLEARFHWVSTSGSSTNFLPIVFGIVF